MIKSLQLGNRTFSNNFIQGPLAGVSCAPFRALTWRYSKPAFSCTEMISAKTILNSSLAYNRRYIEKDPEEGPVCFQLSGSNPLEIAEAVKRVTDAGADLIDLNCGCPVKKIRKKGAGSSLLSQSTTLYQLVKSMKDNTHVPVSIKIRVEGQSSDLFHKELVKVIRDAGTDFVIVHGRHWTEHYETACHYEDIRYFVEALNIPVIGNGDIACITTLKKMLATGCAGIMISRAGVGQPWLIAQLMTELQNRVYTKPSVTEIGLLFIEHTEKLSLLFSHEKFAILQARKFAKYYARDLKYRNEFCAAINKSVTLNELARITKYFFDIK